MSDFEDRLRRIQAKMFHDEFAADEADQAYLYRHITQAIRASGNGAILLEEMSKRQSYMFLKDAVIEVLQQHLHSDAWDALLTRNVDNRTPNGWDRQFSIPLTGSGYAAYHWYDVPTMLRGSPSSLLLSSPMLDQHMHDVATVLLHWVVHSGVARQVIGAISATARSLDLPDSHRSSIVEHVVTQFFVVTFDHTTHQYVIDYEIPWAWQQPFFLNLWTERLRDLDTMHGIYDLVKDRSVGGYSGIVED